MKDTWVNDGPGVFVISIDDDIFELYTDRTRALPVIDPSVVLFRKNSTDSCAYWALSGIFSAEHFPRRSIGLEIVRELG